MIGYFKKILKDLFLDESIFTFGFDCCTGYITELSNVHTEHCRIGMDESVIIIPLVT